ncbi:MAG: glycoside hydrolase family 18 protein [Bacteroidota bacterium]|nr:glycoside hydrolase family 18 protein [Bacteroidota bacterium]
MPKLRFLLLMYLLLINFKVAFCQSNQFAVVAYYSGRAEELDSFSIEKLTHIIFSFSHLKENQLHINNARDTATIQKLVSLKNTNPNLKVLISLGGWSGCATCSEIFSSKKDRRIFVRSVKRISRFFGTDGIDLDWEYPAISGFPGHKYQPADKENFTALIIQLRKKMGKNYEITFAAGGFKQYIDESVEWKKVIDDVSFINLMTYDLVSGYDTTTGNHTALFSTGRQSGSTNAAVNQLINLGVPKNKIVIGAAFYGKEWENVADTGYGIYQRGKYRTNITFRNFDTGMSADSGFISHWDSTANAPYVYNPVKKLFVTYDDKRSIALKTKYALDKGLGGIMFWELAYDSYKNGLLDVIDKVKKNYVSKP